MSDYRKTVALQQQKAAATRTEELPWPPGFEATAETHEQLGDEYLKKGNSVAAFTEYERSLRKDPQRTTARYKIGMLFLGRGLPDEALKDFEEYPCKGTERCVCALWARQGTFPSGKAGSRKGRS